jgi:hypothetical protein
MRQRAWRWWCVVALLLCLLAAPAIAQAPPAATGDRSPAETSVAPKEANVITIGAYINDILAIDLRNHAFTVDMYVWFRWTDAAIDPGKSFEFMNMVNPDNRELKRIYEEPQVQPDGSRYLAYRYHGSFSSKFPIGQYPFDTQVLRIHIEDADRPIDQQRYQWDKLTLNPAITLPGYRIAEPFVTVNDYPYPTTFGDPARTTNETYSRVTIEIPITRPWLSGAVKTLLPIFIIVLCAAAAPALGAHLVEARVGLVITALLTLVALQFATAGNLPEVGYLLMIEQIFIASYAFMLLIIATIVHGSKRADRAAAVHHAVVPLPDSAGIGVLLILLYVVAVAAILWANLFDEFAAPLRSAARSS